MFTNSTIIRMAQYLLHDSPHLFHRYISNGKYGPLLAMTTMVCEWVLHQYETGLFVESKFVPEESTHKNAHYLGLFHNMDPGVVTTLITQLTSNSALARALLITP